MHLLECPAPARSRKGNLNRTQYSPIRMDIALRDLLVAMAPKCNGRETIASLQGFGGTFHPCDEKHRRDGLALVQGQASAFLSILKL